ncbi:MAG: rubredoxin [Butyricimonas paravirosa]
MKKYICTVCSYIYDLAVVIQMVESHLNRIEDIPKIGFLALWRGKEDFEPVEE